MGKPIEIEKPKQLLVEGKDQQNFFEAFLQHIGIEELVQIQDYGGGNELRDFIAAFVKMRRFITVESIGIVRDAEMAAQSTFQSVQSSLRNAQLPSPSQVEIGSAGEPCVRVLILPGGGRRGMLETILCELFSGEPIDKCIDNFFNCAGSLPGVSITNPDKARTFAYLATTSNPHHSVGVAAKAGVWNLDHSAFDKIGDFLRSL